jgi:hypothetical protein
MSLQAKREITRTRGSRPLLYLLFIFFLFFSCALDVPEDAFDYLAPPVITCRLSGVSGDTDIYVDFTGKNNEYYFDGYNVYVSDTDMHMLTASVASFKPVQVDEPGYASATPSYPLEPSGSLRSGTIKLNEYWRTDDLYPYPFVSGTPYYIILCSHHKLLGVRQDGCSNQQRIIFTK